MKSWPVQHAKARFSEMLETCIANGPQLVTKRGAEAAILMSVAEWRRLNATARPTLKDLLLADEPRFELDIPARGQRKSRRPPTFE